MTGNKPESGAVERILAGWRFFGHPVRPGPAEVAAVARRLEAIPAPRVLALGATPELVDAAIDAGARRITVIDWNRDAAEAMRRIARRDWSGVERITADWREPRDDLARSFDAAVGDGTFSFLSFPEDWRLLFALLGRYLVPGGIVATRELFRPPDPFDFPRRVERALARFDREGEDAPEERRFLLFRDMLAYLRMGTVLAAADGGGRVDIEERVRWHDRLGADLARRFPEGDLADAVDAVFGERSKARPIEAVSTVSPEEAKELIGSLGFRLESIDPVGDLPAPGALRLMAARLLEE